MSLVGTAFVTQPGLQSGSVPALPVSAHLAGPPVGPRGWVLFFPLPSVCSAQSRKRAKERKSEKIRGGAAVVKGVHGDNAETMQRVLSEVLNAGLRGLHGAPPWAFVCLPIDCR